MNANIKALPVIGLMLLSLNSCGPGTNDAINYNDKIMDMVNDLTIAHQGFLNQIDGHNLDSLELQQQRFSVSAKKHYEDAKQLPPFAEKKEYADAAIGYFEVLHSLADNEGRHIVRIMRQPLDSLDESDFDGIDSLATSFDKGYDVAFNRLKQAQNTFSTEWKFVIKEKKK